MEKISNLSPQKILYNFSEDSCFKKITKIALIFFGMIAAEVLLTTLLYGITPISVFILGVLKINMLCHMVKISTILFITTLFGFLEFFIFFAIFPLFKPKAKKNNRTGQSGYGKLSEYWSVLQTLKEQKGYSTQNRPI